MEINNQILTCSLCSVSILKNVAERFWRLNQVESLVVILPFVSIPGYENRNP
jgi:hypothetical protein